MSFSSAEAAWLEPDDPPELPEGWWDEDSVKEAEDKIKHLESELTRLQNWVNDCQRGMYINCVYCGHRYGPDKTTPAVMADVLYEHIKICEKHPLSKALSRIKELEEEKAKLPAYCQSCGCNYCE